METIKNKVVPIHYSKKAKILYFDSLEDFDSSSFIYLKKVPKNNIYHNFATHYIDFKKRDKEIVKKELVKFIKEIKNRIDNNNLKMGIPIGDQNGEFIENSYEISKEFLIFLGSNDNHDEEGEFTSSSEEKFKGLLKVGQGLSFLDKNCNFLYDVGGGNIGWTKYKGNLNHDTKYTIIISHWHVDHFKFLPKLIEEDNIEKILLPFKRIYGGQKAKELISKIKDSVKYQIIENNHTFCNYVFYVPIKQNKHNINRNSVLAVSNEWFLTGDQHYEFIKKVIEDKNIKRIKNFQIPHHGSNKNGDVNLLHDVYIENSHVSYGVGNQYGHPNKKIKNYFKKIVKRNYKAVY